MTGEGLSDDELQALEEELLRELSISSALNESVREKARRVRVERERRRRAGGQVHVFRPRPSGGGC